MRLNRTAVVAGLALATAFAIAADLTTTLTADFDAGPPEVADNISTARIVHRTGLFR